MNLKTGLTVTTLYCIWVGAFLLSHSDECADDPTRAVVFQCLTLNELGDFLAGFFAPLALLWLAAAVYIQSKELSEQREELKLTRKEFELSRDVAEEQKIAIQSQAEESRRSAELISIQTEIMLTTFKHEQRKSAENQYLNIISSIRNVLDEFFPNALDRHYSNRHVLKMHFERNELSKYDEIIPQIADEICLLSQIRDEIGALYKIEYFSIGVDRLIKYYIETTLPNDPSWSASEIEELKETISYE